MIDNSLRIDGELFDDGKTIATRTQNAVFEHNAHSARLHTQLFDKTIVGRPIAVAYRSEFMI